MGYDTDVFVVGGGPAGIAAGIAARARGFRVVVADGAAPPITKACGEGLLPDALAALSHLGVTFHEADGHVLRGIRFEDSTASARAEFPTACGLGLRREVLHQRMMERAYNCGVSFLWSAPITGLHEEGVVVGGNKIRARWVIGADGSRSRVRRWSGLERLEYQKGRSAFRQHFRAKPWTDVAEIYWADKTQAYVTPVGANEICVAMISNRPNLRIGEALAGFPKLARCLEGAPVASVERGALTGMIELERVCSGNIALIGDASGGVDAVTGEGLCLSFRQAIALADSLAEGNLASYQVAHRRLYRRPRFMGRLLLLMDRRSAVRKRTLRAMQAAPHLFEGMLAYHVGAARALQLAVTGTLLGWRFLTA
jgi:menaquinone-9 beta-reductase